MPSIRNWDTANLVMSIAPNALKLGDNPVPFNSGTFPVYQGGSAGSKITGILTNMLSGYGYADGKIKFDKVDDRIAEDKNIPITDASKFTVEVWLDYISGGGAGTFYSEGDDGNNFIEFLHGVGNDKIWIRYCVGGTIKEAISTQRINVPGLWHIAARKDGATLQLFINGVEVSGYDAQDTYNLGSKTFLGGANIGSAKRGAVAQNFYGGGMYQVNIYDDAISDARILANYNAGKWNDGIRGVDNEDDTITLTDPANLVPPPASVTKFSDSKYAKLLGVREQMVANNDTFIPLYINEHHINDDSGFFTNVKNANGSDIIPTTIEGIEIPMELISFNKAGETITAVIQVPSVLASSNFVIALQYGGDTAARTKASTLVWSDCYGGSIDYALVAHGEETEADLTDASGNYTATDADITYAQNGKILKAPKGNGTNSISDWGNVTELNSVTKFTTMLWATYEIVNEHVDLWAKYINGSNQLRFFSFTDGKTYFVIKNAGTSSSYYTTSLNTTLKNVVCVYDGDGVSDADKTKVYTNGLAETLTFTGEAQPASTPDLSATTFALMNIPVGFPPEPLTAAPEGILDEFRLIAGALSANQISLHYDNESTYEVNGLWDFGPKKDLFDQFIELKASTITFSVGTAAASADEYVTKTISGAMPTAVIQNGVLTFSVPQINPYIGVGDKVELDDGSPFYIYLNEKIDTRQWKVHDAFGDFPDDKTTPLPVTTIDKTFNDVRAAINGDTSGAYALMGNQHDLISKRAMLRIACYEMYDDMGANTLSISNLWVVDDKYRVKIYTPRNISIECNKSQKHIRGRADLGGYRVASSSNVINMAGSRVIIDGLGVGDNGYSPGYAIRIDSNNERCQVINNVVFKSTNGIEVIATAPEEYTIANNIVRDCSKGIILNPSSTIGGACFDNDVVNCSIAGIEYSGNNLTEIANNIVQDCGTDIEDNSVGLSNVSNCITSDASCAGGVNCHPSTSLKFEDKVNYDYRPHISDTVAYTGGAGLDLSTNSKYGFVKDIDGEEIDSTWCIGAFHKTPEVTFSVGPDTDIKVAANYSIADAIMTFSAAQTHELLSAGCVVTDAGTSHLLKRKISNTKWEVTDFDGTPASDAAGPVTIITIKHHTTNLYDLITDSAEVTHIFNRLGSINLAATDINVKVACVAGVSSRTSKVDDYTCDRHRHVDIFAPDLSNADYLESNQNRKHNGKWGELSYISSTTDFPANQPHEIYGDRGGYGIIFNSGADFCTVKGVQLSSSIDGVLIDGAKNIIVEDNIVKDCKGNGITVTGKEKSNENLIAKNIIYQCGGSGIEIQHGAAFETYYEAKFGTPADNGFIITSIFGHSHIFKKYTVTVTFGVENEIDWYPGRIVITVDPGSTFDDILTSGNIFGTPWATLAADGTNPVNSLSETRMEDAVTLLEYHEDGLGISHYIYNNTISKCQRGIYIETLATQDWMTNVAVLRNNAISECDFQNYYSTHVFPITILAENNWSDDQSIYNFYGSGNSDTLISIFVNPFAEDYRISLYDLERMEGINLVADENFQIEHDNVGIKYATYPRWAIGANTWKFRKKSIHCSVGAEGGNLDEFPSGREITIENGIAQFNENNDIGADIGIGDRIQYDDGGPEYCYLAEKGAQHRWCVVDGSGNQIISLATKDVTDFTRVSNSLEDAFNTDITAEFPDINNKDIVSDAVDLCVWCCDDNDTIDDVDEVVINDWDTSPFYRIYVQTPWDIRTQCMSQQRNTGVWDGYRIRSTQAPNGFSGIVINIVNTNHVVIEGLSVEPHNTLGVGIGTNSNRDGIIISKNVIKNGNIGIEILGTEGRGNRVYGNILYDQIQTNISTDGGSVINNTAVGTSVNGILVENALDESVNNICQDQTAICFGGFGKIRACVSSDGSAGSDDGCISNATLNFVDKPGKDFHLHRGDWHALNRGTKRGFLFQFKLDTSAYTDYSFYRDIDNESMNNDEWSIGADSMIDLETIDLYFSASRDTTDFKQGASPYLEILNGIMTFSESQDHQKIGIGDKVDYDIGNKICYLYQKISDTMWEVRDKFGIAPLNTSGPVDLNAINKAFTVSTHYIFDETDSESIQQFLGDSNNPFLHLRSARYRLHLSMYKHNVDQEYTTLRYFDTNESNYLRLFAPKDIRNQCNVSQAHNGSTYSGAQRINIQADTHHALSIYVPHVWIDGILVSGDNANDTDSIRLYNSRNCKIVNNMLMSGPNGIKPIDMGHDDFTGDHFEGSIRTDIWHTNFYSNWELRNVPGIGYVAIPEWAQISVKDNLTDPGTLKVGDFDYELGMVLGSDDSVGQKLRFILEDGGGIKAECNWENGVLSFGGSTLNFPWKFNREYKMRLVRGGTITSDGLYEDDAGEDSTTSLYYLDNFNEGDGEGTEKWIKHPGTYTSWSGSHWIEVEGPKAHGFSYIDLWVASEPLPGGTKLVGRNANNIIVNNVAFDKEENGIITSNTDILYNNTVDDCVEYCYHNETTDVLINNIGQRGGTNDFYNGDTAEFCIASDTSLVVTGENRNINSLILTFVDKISTPEERDYHLELTSDDSAIWSAKMLTGNPDYPFDFDGGGVPRLRKWDRGALEYQTKRVVYAIGDNGIDHQTKPSIGSVTYVIEENAGKSYITFSTPQTNQSMGIGSQVVDIGSPFSNGCLIIEKIDESKWLVADYIGDNVSDKSGSVYSIYRVFNTLWSALDTSGFISSIYLNSSSFQAVGVRVELICYNEGRGRSVEQALNVDYIGCDKHHNLRIKTPSDTITECNSSQRHDGLYDEGYKFEPEIFEDSIASMYFFQTTYIEIEGILLNADEQFKDGINLFDCRDAYVGYNVVKDCGGNGIVLQPSVNPEDVVFNNLVYDCVRDGIVVIAEYSAFFSILIRINNNTVVNCRRAFYLEKFDEEYGAGLSIELRNNIAQDSKYQDYVSTYENHFGRFALYNCISSDLSSWLFPGTGNIKNQYVRFIGRPNNFNLHKVSDGFAVDNALDLSTDWLLPFFDDIGGRERDPNEYDIGAFEMVDIIGSGDLITGPVAIDGAGSESMEFPIMTLYLRETEGDYLPHVDPRWQFTDIEGADPDYDINAFLALQSTADNVIIYVQGGKVFQGTFELQDRNPREVLIKTYPLEAYLGPASHIYVGPIVDDASDQKFLTYDGMKVYSDDAAAQDYLINNTAATKALKFINSIVQVNMDSVIDNVTDATVGVTHSIIIYRNG